MIAGVVLKPLQQFVDERGAVYRVFRNTQKDVEVNEVYISKVNHGVVKGWKCHRRMTQRFVVPYGQMKIVLFDGREDSETHGDIMEVLLDAHQHYAQLTVPAGIWYAFGCLSADYSLMLNVADLIHEDQEAETLPLNTPLIQYVWK